MESEKKSPPGHAGRRKRARLWLVYVLLLAICGLLLAVVASLHKAPAPPIALPEISYDSRGPQHVVGAPRAAAEHAESRVSSRERTKARAVAPSETGIAPAAFVRPAPRGTLFFVIDDVGNNIDELRPFLSFPGPLTLSILPRLSATKLSYEMITSAGKMAILHLPMQAVSDVFPGPGAIYVGMSESGIDSAIAKDLDGMDGIAWVNNHEGSRATSDETTMTYVLSFLKSRDLSFLDSMTTPDSVVGAVAARLSLPYYKRNSLFLDNVVEKDKILAMIDAGLAVAQHDGYSVMIGHVWDKELAAILSNLYPKLVAEGFALATLAELPEAEARRVRSGN